MGTYWSVKENKWQHVRKRSKFFSNKDPAYCYPLFKTHKIKEDEIATTAIQDIPTRLLQASNNITTSRVTIMLEHLLKEPTKLFCQMTPNEYCKDTTNYLVDLVTWQKENHQRVLDAREKGDHLYLVAADVRALYPSIPRKIIIPAILEALKHSNYPKETHQIIADLALYCVENVVINYKELFASQDNGIITGDFHCVSLANIVCKYITSSIADCLKKSEIFRRFIDDIMYLAIGHTTNEDIKHHLEKAFGEHGLELEFREVSTEMENGTCVEFLDVNHVIDKSKPCGFKTTDYKKPTAIHRRYIHGKSHNPTSVFKSILHSESIRLRKLNEEQEDYLKALKGLKEKALKSFFPKKMVNEMLEKTCKFMDRFSNKKTKENENKDPDLPWGTQVPSLLRLSKQQSKLVPKAMISYRRPPTLGTFLTKFKKLSKSSDDVEDYQSKPCSKCTLCGSRNPYKGMSMVWPVSMVKSKTTGKKYQIKQHLTCKNFGIYMAECILDDCGQQYIGLTKNPFSTRWTAHRTKWKIGDTQGQNDDAALNQHYAKFHQKTIPNKPPLHGAFKVTFLQQPDANKLEIAEDNWATKLKPTINIQRMVTPTCK